MYYQYVQRYFGSSSMVSNLIECVRRMLPASTKRSKLRLTYLTLRLKCAHSQPEISA